MFAKTTKPSNARAANWADMVDVEDEVTTPGGIDGIVTEEPDGTRIITTYFREADGRQVKKERRVRIERNTILFPRAVRERHRNWVRFGFERFDSSKPENKKV